jgi:hypothetical protein
MFTVYEFFSQNLDTSVIKADEGGVPLFQLQDSRQEYVWHVPIYFILLI